MGYNPASPRIFVFICPGSTPDKAAYIAAVTRIHVVPSMPGSAISRSNALAGTWVLSRKTRRECTI
jgi:hypothetical protein